MPPPAPAEASPAGEGTAPAAGTEANAQEALDSAPGTFGAPNAARQAAKLSDARNAGQDAAAAAAAGEPHS